MIGGDALFCPQCGSEIDGRLVDWGMQDGESRMFRCGQCGSALTVTKHIVVSYTVREADKA